MGKRAIEISPLGVFRVLEDGGCYVKQYGIPDGARLVGHHFDLNRDSMWLVIEHESYSEDDSIPIIESPVMRKCGGCYGRQS